MNITDDDETRPANRDRGLVVRCVMSLILAGMMIVALNWALNVTNANARQVSSNLTNLQNGFDRAPSRLSTNRNQHKPGGESPVTSSRISSGPTLEPVDSGQ